MTKTIIVYRSERGIGDACMLLPTVEKLEELNPDAEIVVVMNRPQSAVFEHKDYTIIPVERFDITDYDNAVFYNVSRCCLQYEQIMRQRIAKSRFTLFAEHCGVDSVRNARENVDSVRNARENEAVVGKRKLIPQYVRNAHEVEELPNNKKFDPKDISNVPQDISNGVEVEKKGTIPITEEEIIHIYNRMPILRRRSSGDKVVGIVLKSMQDFRTYPHTDLLLDYFTRCSIFRRDEEVIPILIDHEEEVEGVISTKDLDMRETIALISQMDLLIGPDTGPMHLGGTLGVPTLWLFGPTDPRLRVLYYPNAEYIWHPCREGKACWYDYCGFLHCLWMISPWEVAKRARKILEKAPAANDAVTEANFPAFLAGWQEVHE